MRKTVCCFLTALTLMTGNISGYALDITSGAACVMDAQTGKLYFEMNSNDMLAPASMTKVMTVYIIYEKIAEGVLSKDTLITADYDDETASKDWEASNVPLKAGVSYTIDELIGAIMIPSACAASAMVGKYISGSEAEFAHLMNETAQKLGINAYYEDASGLSNNNRITAWSMAELARVLITKYPDILNYTSKPSISFAGRNFNNTNKMLPGKTYEYLVTDGLKTGTTQLAGCCFAGTAVDGDIRLISITMHSEYSSARFEDTIKLLDYGFGQAHYQYDNILTTDMRLFINGNEVPAFVYSGPNEGLYFIIEDLKDYGFDINWNGETKTVSAVLNNNKPITPIPMDIYRAEPAGGIFRSIDKSLNVSAEISLNGKTYIFKNVHSLNGYIAVSADELANIAQLCQWNGEEKKLDIVIGEEEV